MMLPLYVCTTYQVISNLYMRPADLVYIDSIILTRKSKILQYKSVGYQNKGMCYVVIYYCIAYTTKLYIVVI